MNELSRTMKWHLISFAAFFVLFMVFPSLDLWFSGLFYKDASGFYLNENAIIQFIYKATERVALIAALWIIVCLLIGYVIQGIDTRFKLRSWFLFACMLIGPGLIVNTTLKDEWDRARPRQVEAFGGDAQFTRPWIPTDQCDSNCSFVSGHSSAGFFLMAFGFFFTRREKKLWWWIGLGAGSVFGLTRVIQGGHFLSDVIFCYYVLWFVFEGLYRLFLQWDEHQKSQQWLTFDEDKTD